MATVRRTFDLDPETDARLNALVAEKGKDAAAVVADAGGYSRRRARSRLS